MKLTKILLSIVSVIALALIVASCANTANNANSANTAASANTATVTNANTARANNNAAGQNTNAGSNFGQGSPERGAVMDALRADVRSHRGLGGSIVFRVNTLNAQDDWVFVVATPQGADGQRLREFEASCECDSDVIALLRRRGDSWQVVERVICPCDVAYADWDQRFGAPSAIFRLNN